MKASEEDQEEKVAETTICRFTMDCGISLTDSFVL